VPRVSFEKLPEHGRAWVFPASRPLIDEEASAFLEAVDDFLAGWSAHGAPLRSGRELVDRQFLLVGVDVDAEAPSGCSIDALVNRLRALGTDLGVTVVDHAPVWFREGGEIRRVTRGDFRTLASEGSVGPDVRVVDTTLTTVGQVRDGRLERPASETWHGRAFFAEHARG
jgi:hypothetical protein